VVAAGVPAHELVGVIDRDRSPLGRDPLGPFDDGTSLQRLLQLLAQLLLFVQLGGDEHVAGRHIGPTTATAMSWSDHSRGSRE
jgi:hypothetical protein